MSHRTIMIGCAVLWFASFDSTHGQDNEKAGNSKAKCIAAVDFPSYELAVDSKLALAGHELRQALILALKLRGIPVLADSFLPEAAPSFDSRRPQSAARGALGAVVNHVFSIQHREPGKIAIEVWHKTDVEEPFELTRSENVASANGALWDIAVELAGRYKSPNRKSLMPFHSKLASALREDALPGQLDWNAILDPEEYAKNPLDMPWIIRIASINDDWKALGSIGGAALNQPETAVQVGDLLARILRIQALHACYYTRANDPLALRYAGEALNLASILSRLFPDDPKAKELHKEVRWLMHRMVARQNESIANPMLPESRLLKHRDEVVAAPGTPHFEVESLFDYLLLFESHCYSKGYEEAAYSRDFSNDGWGLDGFALAWEHSFSTFTAASWLQQAINARGGGKTLFEDEVEILNLVIPSSAGSHFDKAQSQYLQMLEETEGEPSLRVPGTTSAATNANSRGFLEPFLRSLGVIRCLRFPEELETYDFAAASCMLGWHDLRHEAIARYESLTFGAASRYRMLGHSCWTDLSALLDRYGRHRLDTSRRLHYAPTTCHTSVLNWKLLASALKSNLQSPNPLVAETLLDCLSSTDHRTSLLEGTPRFEAKEAFGKVLKRAISDLHLFPPGAFIGWVDQSLVAKASELRLKANVNQEAVHDLRCQMLDEAFNYLFHWAAERQPRPQRRIAHEQPMQRAYQLFRFGDSATAWKLTKSFLENAESSESSLPASLEIAARAGELDSCCEMHCNVQPTGFGRDERRIYALYWKDNFENHPESTERGTSSARDYFARTEFLLRSGEYAEANLVAESYHYGSSTLNSLQMAIAAALDGSPDDESLRQRLTNALDRFLATPSNGSGKYNWAATWLKMLNRHFGDRPGWTQYRDSSLLPRVALIQTAHRTLAQPADESALRQLLSDLQSQTEPLLEGKDRITSADYPQIFEMEQDALSRLLASGSAKGTQPWPKPLVEEAATIIRRSAAAIPMTDDSVEWSFSPLPSRFLAMLLAEGCSLKAVGDLASQLAQAGLPLSPQDPSLALALSDPRSAGWALLQQEESTPSFQRRFSSIQLDLPSLFAKAFELGIDDVAESCALQAVQAGNGFPLLACYLAGREDAANWIERNARTESLARQWMETLSRLGPEPWKTLGFAERDASLPRPTAPPTDLSIFLTRQGPPE